MDGDPRQPEHAYRYAEVCPNDPRELFAWQRQERRRLAPEAVQDREQVHQKYESQQRSINIRLLRGDTWPAGDFWTRSFWGTLRKSPFLLDSYWNPAYGPDPGTRPRVILSHPYWNMSAAGENGNTWQQVPSGPKVPQDQRPYHYLRGIFFVGDPSYSPYTPGWPSLALSDHQVVSDCVFQNVMLMPSHIIFNLPITGGMVHRCQLYDTHLSQVECAPDDGSGGTTLVLPSRFANPRIGYKPIAAGQDWVMFDDHAPYWKIRGWQIRVSGGGHTDITTLTKPLDRHRRNVDAPFVNAYPASSRTTLTLIPPDGTRFTVAFGTGSGPTVYTLSGYSPGKRTAAVTPAMPTLDSSSRLCFLPDMTAEDYGVQPHVQGVYCDNASDFVFSQSVVDQCGWIRSDGDKSANTIFSHNLYLSFQARGLVTWGNWLTKGGSWGLMQRGGGTVAYNVFAENTHALYQCSTSSSAMHNLFWRNGLFELHSKWHYDDISNHVVHDFNIVLSPTGCDEKGKLIWDFGVIAATHFSHGIKEGAPAYYAARHNSFIDAGGFQIGIRAPVPGRATLRNNLIVNRPKTGVDYKDNGLRSMVCSLEKGWTTNGACRVGDDYAWEDIDCNAYLLSANNRALDWLGLATRSFQAWQASGRDHNGVALDSLTFQDGSYDLEAWAKQNKLGVTFDELRENLKARETGVWSDAYDAQKCYQAFQVAYAPDSRSLPALDKTPLGYYGAADPRAPVGVGTVTPAAGRISPKDQRRTPAQKGATSGSSRPRP